ncbi:hypothetical protein C8F04DRAFT_1104582 [Mycena alexandri]|uniref:Secreted peptide n=1 Tax=Mycena alexandri TaxID=1745969 RepID=A0AAD6SVW3_9AGAR|nr:hypothetical protein C8F04DRAFT_1104582 [Mycena alexandri]
MYALFTWLFTWLFPQLACFLLLSCCCITVIPSVSVSCGAHCIITYLPTIYIHPYLHSPACFSALNNSRFCLLDYSIYQPHIFRRCSPRCLRCRRTRLLLS